jgi:hypothetical protein
MNADAVLHGGVAVAAERDDAVDEIGLLRGSGSGFQRIWLGGVGTSLNGPLRIRPCGNSRKARA